MNLKYNEEQYEALQNEANEKRNAFIETLSDEAREKFKEIENVIGSLNRLGTPYHLYIQAPTENESFAHYCYNNTHNSVGPPSPTSSFLGGDLVRTIALGIGSSMGDFPEIRNPISRFFAFVQSSFVEPSEDATSSFYQKMNEIWKLNFEPKKVFKEV